MDPEFLKTLPALGVGGVLAAIFYWQNNKNAKEYADKATELSALFATRIEALLNLERGRTEMLVQLVKENTIQTATNSTLVGALHRRLDTEEREKRENGGHK